jgi:hypothetical protein
MKYVDARLRAVRRGLEPPFDPAQPDLWHAELAGLAAREPLFTRRVA